MNEERRTQIEQGLREYANGQGAEKFTDNHINAEPELRDVAIEYLSYYEGELEFMNDLRKKGPNFSVGQIRGILNVALSQTRERGGRVPPTPVNGLALRGYYIMPNNGPTIVIRKWQEDGTSIVGYEDPISKRIEAFGSVMPGGAEFVIWGRYRTNDAIQLIADDFFVQANGMNREAMMLDYSNATNKCAHCGETERINGGKYCLKCSEAVFAEEPGY